MEFSIHSSLNFYIQPLQNSFLITSSCPICHHILTPDWSSQGASWLVEIDKTKEGCAPPACFYRFSCPPHLAVTVCAVSAVMQNRPRHRDQIYGSAPLPRSTSGQDRCCKGRRVSCFTDGSPLCCRWKMSDLRKSASHSRLELNPAIALSSTHCRSPTVFRASHDFVLVFLILEFIKHT